MLTANMGVIGERTIAAVSLFLVVYSAGRLLGKEDAPVGGLTAVAVFLSTIRWGPFPVFFALVVALALNIIAFPFYILMNVAVMATCECGYY